MWKNFGQVMRGRPGAIFRCLVIAGLALPWFVAVAWAEPKQPVDLELLIAIDVSHSISADEHRLQINGVARAFRSPRLIEIITGRGSGQVVAAVMFWAGKDQQVMAVPWTALDRADDVLAFADEINRHIVRPWGGVNYTAIGEALLRGADSVLGNGFEGRRQVIDVSGDDPGNEGIATWKARDRVIAQGIVINGLPILSGRKEHEEKAALVDHYQTEVAGGAGGFVIPALSFDDFPRAMFAKLFSEIAGLDIQTRRHAGATRGVGDRCGSLTPRSGQCFVFDAAALDPQ